MGNENVRCEITGTKFIQQAGQYEYGLFVDVMEQNDSAFFPVQLLERVLVQGFRVPDLPVASIHRPVK